MELSKTPPKAARFKRINKAICLVAMGPFMPHLSLLYPEFHTVSTLLCRFLYKLEETI